MRSLCTLLFVMALAYCQAQDYYEIRTENQMIFNYPKSVGFSLVGYDGSSEDELVMDKKYKEIQVEAPWYDTPMVYRNAEIGLVKRVQRAVSVSTNYPEAAKPKEVERSIQKSLKREGRYNLELTFSNDLLFSYQDGDVKATQKGVDLIIVNHYLVQTEEGLFKISFNPANGQLWYVIEL